MRSLLPKLLTLAVTASAGLIIATAQEPDNAYDIRERSSFTLNSPYNDIQFKGFSIIYHGTDGMLYNLMNKPVFSSSVAQYYINPTGASLAVMYKNGKTVSIISNREKDLVLALIKEERTVNPFITEKEKKGVPGVTAATYTSDARELLTADEFGRINTYSTETYLQTSSLDAGKVYDHIAISPNKYFIAASYGKEMDLWDVETGEIKRIVHFAGKVNHITFSPDSREIAVSCDTAGLHVVNSIDHHRDAITDGIKNVRHASFHPDGKYLAYTTEDSIFVYNLINHKTVFSSGTAEGNDLSGVMTVNFHRNNGIVTLSHNTGDQVVFWDMTSLPPLYRSRLSEEVDKMMSDWIRQMDGESMEEYRVRVTDENAARQKAMLLDQAATAIATQIIQLDDPFISSTYDMANHAIDIKFKDLNAIKLEVPEDEFEEFTSGKLVYTNPIYTLDDNDEFQLVYLEVVNETTDKTYIFDKRNYIIDEVDFGEEDLDYIPVAVLQKVNMEMESLQEQTRQIVEEKKQENVITDKTVITIDSEIKGDFNSAGEKIYNYNLRYQYDVSEGFSYQEDFGPGKFKTGESNAAITMLEALRNALEGDMSKYMDEAKSVEITITGTADAIPVGRILYDGIYGEYNETPYYAKDELSSMTVTDETDIRNNEQLAFIRAAGVKDWLEKEVGILQTYKDKCTFNFKTEVSDVRGSEFRRIIVEVRFKDIFNQ